MTSRPPPSNRHDDLDNYDVGDLSDDPFASPSPPSKKRKEPDESGLGIDQEVSVQKRARVPNVKLDEERYVNTWIAFLSCSRLLTCCLQIAWSSWDPQAKD